MLITQTHLRGNCSLNATNYALEGCTFQGGLSLVASVNGPSFCLPSFFVVVVVVFKAVALLSRATLKSRGNTARKNQVNFKIDRDSQ